MGAEATTPARDGRPRVLAIASGGGHWVQLCRVIPAFDGADLAFVTVKAEYEGDRPNDRFYVVDDASRWDRWRIVTCSFQILRILLRERPDYIFTTGALPGGLAILFGRFLGARSIWLDSIANVDEVSLTGRLAGRIANLYLTQWPHLAGPSPTSGGKPEYSGAVL